MEEKYRQIDFMKKRIFLDRNFRGQLIKNALCFWRRRDKIWTKLGLPWFDENSSLHNSFFNYPIKQFMRPQAQGLKLSFKLFQTSLFQISTHFHYLFFKLNWVCLFWKQAESGVIDSNYDNFFQKMPKTCFTRNEKSTGAELTQRKFQNKQNKKKWNLIRN